MITTIIASDGTFLINGVPTFLNGFFDVSDDDINDSGTYARLVNRLNLIAAAGFNFMIVSAWEALSQAQYVSFCQQAASLGVWIAFRVTPSAPGGQQAFVQLLAGQTSVIGWYVADDIVDSTELAAANNATVYHAWDPNHVTFASCLPSSLSSANGLQALLGESYPIGNNPPLTVADAFATPSKLVGTLRAYQCPMLAGQTFAWVQNNQPPPTFQQYWCMLALACIAGVKGVANYTFFDQKNYLPNCQELWAGLQTLPASVKAWIPFLLNGRKGSLMFVANGFACGTWQLGNQGLVLAANAGTSPASYEIKLPDGTLADVSLDPCGVYAQVSTLQGPTFTQVPTAGTVIRTIPLFAEGTNPDGTQPTYSWGTVDIQPGAVNFTNTTQQSTIVTATVPGTYNFRCTLTSPDGLKRSADVSVEV